MSFVCKICEKDPTSHSFKKIGEKENVNYFYTCPAQASKYDDNKGILYHYNGILDEYSGQPWVWIFDSKGFSAKHALNISLAIDLAKLIKKHSKNLRKIEIINATWHVRATLKIVLPFIDNIKIQINDNIT